MSYLKESHEKSMKESKEECLKESREKALNEFLHKFLSKTTGQIPKSRRRPKIAIICDELKGIPGRINCEAPEGITEGEYLKKEFRKES